jgi:hypothetical protein
VFHSVLPNRCWIDIPDLTCGTRQTGCQESGR